MNVNMLFVAAKWFAAIVGALLVRGGCIGETGQVDFVANLENIIGALFVAVPILVSAWPRIRKKSWKELLGSMFRYALAIGGILTAAQASCDAATIDALKGPMAQVLGGIVALISLIWGVANKKAPSPCATCEGPAKCKNPNGH